MIEYLYDNEKYIVLNINWFKIHIFSSSENILSGLTLLVFIYHF